MTTANKQHLAETDSQISKNLHLVDFTNVAPDALQQQVTQALTTADNLLDEMAAGDSADGDNLSTDKAGTDKTNKDKSDMDKLSAESALADILAFEHINLDLERNWGIISHLNSVMSNADIRRVHHDVLPLLSAFGTKVGQHKPLYHRYQTVKNNTALFDTLDAARKRAIDLAIQEFELSGIALPSDKQARYADIQNQLSTLSAKFSDNVLDATQAYHLPLTKAHLKGITDSGLTMLEKAGERYKADLLEKEVQDRTYIDALPQPFYVATLDIPVYLAVMTHADDRNLRQQLYKAYVTRASEFDMHSQAQGESFDNSDIMADILRLRAEKAALLGFDNYAQLSLSRKMADNVTQVTDFLRDLAKKATPAAQQDLQELQTQALQYGIAKDDIQPWDTAYLAEKVKQEKFSLSQEEIRPYFPMPKVIAGLFAIVGKLYGIKAVEHTHEVTLWHDDVRFYQLYDHDDTLIGGFYFDLYARQGKRGGAWMSGFQSRYVYTPTPTGQEDTETQNDTQYEQLPVCFMVGNFTPPTSDKPSLLTHNEVLTLFHEFGHGLHHLLTTVTVGDVAGVRGVEWDAVELPSQFMENWAWDSEGIALISAHVETGKPLPQDKLEALLAAKNFQSGMQTLRQIEFALFDVLIHAKSPAPDYCGILSTLQTVRDDIALLCTPEYNRFANGFSHIFAGGYAAGYYSYKWAELLSADAFSRFEEEGIFNAQTGKAFRESVLSVGGSLPAKINFETFRGRGASIDALLRHSGFVATND